MKELIELQPVEWQQMYRLVRNHLTANTSKEETVNNIISVLTTDYSFPVSSVAPIANLIYDRLTAPEFYDKFLDVCLLDVAQSDEGQIFLYNSDVQQLITFAQELYNSSPAHNFDSKILQLLIAFTVYYRKFFHSSHWVYYDRKVIFYLADITRLSTTQQNQLTSYLHSHYNLNMEVVGSKQPIPCFTLEWCHDILESQKDDEKIYFGPYTPNTIKIIYKYIIDTQNVGGKN